MWVVVAVVILVLELLVELYLEYRQLKNLERATGPDPIVKQGITPEDFAKSKAYEIAVTRFHFISIIYSSILGLASLFLMRRFWGLTSFAGPELYRIVVFTALTCLLDAFTTLPVNWYRVFVIEERYGFNNTTKGLWMRDEALGFVVAVALTSILQYGLLFIYTIAGK
jgi:STE24 endopeptidase